MRKIRYYKSIKLEKIGMNCKLEKFWNNTLLADEKANLTKWTVNLKSFEIIFVHIYVSYYALWTVNLKSFEIKIMENLFTNTVEWTVNLKSFEIKKFSIFFSLFILWTVNLKSFEMFSKIFNSIFKRMNCKLEKFWNFLSPLFNILVRLMNCKLEKFWNKEWSKGN